MIKELYRKTADVIYTNFLWILFSFLGLLLTLGAATTAMFSVMFQILMVNEPTSVFSTYFKSFKTNFIQSTLVWLCLIAIGIPLYMMYNYSINENNVILLMISIVGGYQLVIFTMYVFPVMAVFQTKNTGQLIKNVLIMSNTNIWTNIKLFGTLAFAVLLIVFVHVSLVLVAVGLYGIMVSFHLRQVFKPYLKELGEIEDDEVNR